MFEKARLAEQKSTEKQEEEEATLKDYENKIDSFISTRSGTSKVKVLYDGNTDSKGYINSTTGVDAERTLYDNMSIIKWKQL